MSSVYMIYVFRQQESGSIQPSWRSELSSRWVSYSRWSCILGQKGGGGSNPHEMRLHNGSTPKSTRVRTHQRQTRWKIWLWSERNSRRADAVDVSKILANSPNKTEIAISYYREMRIGENGEAHTLAILGHSGKGGNHCGELKYTCQLWQ